MLKEIQLRNFRCFDEHKIVLQPLTIVVGANNAGKSTVIEALRILALVVNRLGALNFQDVPEWLELSWKYRGVAPSLRGIDFNTASLFHRFNYPPARIRGVFENGWSIDVYVGPDGALHALVFDDQERLITTKAAALRAAMPSLNVLPQVAPLSREEVILDPEYARQVTSSSWASLHFRNQLHYYSESFSTFKELAEATWPGLRVLKLEKQSNNPREPIGLLVQDGDFVAEIGWMGHGLQMWLQTIWFLARSKTAGCVVLDEPDVYMHADLQKKLIRLLKGRYPQTVVATHSVEIMTEVEAGEVLIIDRKAPQSIYAASIPSVQDVIDNIGGVHNLQLARLWNSRRFLLVEGEDVGLLKTVQNHLFRKTREPLDTIPHMSLGGWGNWDYAVGSRLVIKNSVGETVRIYCIFDSDYHTKDEIDARYREAKQRGIELHIWERKEIENYFICPEAVLRIVATHKRKGANPTIKDVEAKIDEIAESLRRSVLMALLAEYHAQNKGEGAPGAYDRAEAHIEAVWGTTDGRWSIVSGKAVISQLSRWTQETYGVGLNAYRLATEMTRAEIPDEMMAVVTAMERGLSFVDVEL
jgi:hypothetical protein